MPLPMKQRKNLSSILLLWVCSNTWATTTKARKCFTSRGYSKIGCIFDVMSHKIYNKVNDTEIMINHGNMLRRLQILSDRSAQKDFKAFISQWLSIFDAAMYVLVHRGSNLCMNLVKQKLHEVKSQLIPIPTKASSDIETNERSYCYLQKSIDMFLLQKDIELDMTAMFFLLTWRLVGILLNILTKFSHTITSLVLCVRSSDPF